MRMPKFQLKPFNYSVEWQVYDIPVVKSSITIKPLYGHLPTFILLLVVFSSIRFSGEIVPLMELIILYCNAIANSELRAPQRRRKVENNQNKIFESASRWTNAFKLY